MSEVSWQLEGDGQIVPYADPYKNITADDAIEAEAYERLIIQEAVDISDKFLKMAAMLSDFEQRKLYRARSFDTFQEWANSENLRGIGYRTARNLIRIYREAIPIFEKHDKMDLVPMLQTSKMQALLPILADEDAEEKLIEAAFRIQDVPVKVAHEIIAEVRGLDPDAPLPTVFKAKVTRGESFHRVKITALAGDDIYDCGTLNIRPRDWSVWDKRFGRFCDYD